MPLWPLQMFDPAAGVAIIDRRLPHWSQAGAVCFITWRTADSMPQSVLRRWYADRDAWLRRHGIDPAAPDRSERIAGLEPSLRAEFVKTFSERWHRHLDTGHGACVLARSDLSQIVADSLHHGDATQYELTDYVIMPNHIHLLAAFPDEEAMLAQCESWKRFMATAINRILGTKGRFWQQDGFDHLVRTLEQFHFLRRYIAENPKKAHLQPTQYRHYSKPLTK